MLVRISCKPCGISSLWTDEPHCFLQTICHRQRSCEARLVGEGPPDPAEARKTAGPGDGPEGPAATS